MAKNATSARKTSVAEPPEKAKRQASAASAASSSPSAAGEQLSPESGWQRRHLLDLDDFSAAEIDLVLDTADAMKEVLAREVPRLPTLRGSTIVTLFYEASTRTRASFELAGKVLGADVINVSASSSSVQKGEALIDTIRTIQAIGADLLVLRHHASGERDRCCRTDAEDRAGPLRRRRARSRRRALPRIGRSLPRSRTVRRALGSDGRARPEPASPWSRPAQRPTCARSSRT